MSDNITNLTIWYNYVISRPEIFEKVGPYLYIYHVDGKCVYMDFTSYERSDGRDAYKQPFMVFGYRYGYDYCPEGIIFNDKRLKLTPCEYLIKPDNVNIRLD